MINLAGIIHDDGANGPGLRCTVFVQGCKRHCKGCHSEHTWAFGTGVDISSEELANEILQDPIETGVTISGGDPVYQYNDLLDTLIYIKQKVTEANREYDYMLFTGADLNELIHKCHTQERFKLFLSMFNYIKVGRFEQDKVPSTVKWAGSSNQKIYTPVVTDNDIEFIDVTNQI